MGRVEESIARFGPGDMVNVRSEMGWVTEGTGLDLDWMFAGFVVVLVSWFLAVHWVLRVHLAFGKKMRWHWAFNVVAGLVLIRFPLGLGVPEVPALFTVEQLRDTMLAILNLAAFRAAADAGIAAFFVLGLIIMGRRWRRITDR